MRDRDDALAIFRPLPWLVAAVLWMSAIYNTALLGGAVFMLQVYDRVLPSGVIETLVALCIVFAGVYILQGIFDALRREGFGVIAANFNATAAPRAYQAMHRLQQAGAGDSTASQARHDVDTVAAFLRGPAPPTFLDVAAVPLFIGFLFYIHSWTGWFIAGCAVALIIVTVVSHWRTRQLIATVTATNARRQTLARNHADQSETARANGFESRLAEQYADANAAYVDLQESAGRRSAVYTAISRTLQMAAQSGVIAVAALLVVEGEVPAGMMIAAMIAGGRALGPLTQAAGQYVPLLKALQAYRRLRDTITDLPPDRSHTTAYPPPTARLSVEAVALTAPQTGAPIVRDITFELAAGEALAVIGPSASGKTSLARSVLGIQLPTTGAVRLDALSNAHWPDDWRVQHVGYLAQNAKLTHGTIAQNIARFDPEAEHGPILAAAETAGIDSMVKRLADGYETQIHDATLTPGQQQRIALAAALYGDPFLVVLDEPNANLDSKGDDALLQALHRVRDRGGIAIVMTHRRGVLQAVSHVAVLQSGRLVEFGPRNQVLGQIIPGPGQAPGKPTP